MKNKELVKNMCLSDTESSNRRRRPLGNKKDCAKEYMSGRGTDKERGGGSFAVAIHCGEYSYLEEQDIIDFRWIDIWSLVLCTKQELVPITEVKLRC